MRSRSGFITLILFILSGVYLLNTWVIKRQNREIIEQMELHQLENEANIQRKRSDLKMSKPDSLKLKELDTMEKHNEELKREIAQKKKALGVE